MVSITVLNVGYGDSIILHLEEMNSHKWGVIDCHNPHLNSDSPTLSFLKKNRVNELEFICLTHPDYDHYSGIEQLLNYYNEDNRRVLKYYDFGLDFNKYTSFSNSSRQDETLKNLYLLIFKLVNENRINWEQLSEDKCILKSTNFYFTSKGPYQKDTIKYMRSVGKRFEKFANGEHIDLDKNLLSVISIVAYNGYIVLLASDSTKENMENFLRKLNYSSTKMGKNKFVFIKVPHHGSRNNNHSGLWQKYVRAHKTIAAISSGKKYDHPHLEVVQDIVSNNVELYCTNKSGCLKGHSRRILSGSTSMIDPKIQEGLDLISNAVPDDDPYHGNITFESNGVTFSVQTEFHIPPIR